MTAPVASIDQLRCGSCTMRSLCDMLQRAAASSSNVLVVGEDGTGKGLAARSLHEMSPRAAGPFVVFDAGALREDDVEQELFGDGDDGGLLEGARGGTLFLDEVADLPHHAQARLVRAVDRRGSLDVRVIASTQHDLLVRCESGSFRSDLFHRLAVVKIELPPLRQRTADIPVLARTMLRRHAATQRKNVRTIAHDVMALLVAHSWPGNIRELSNIIEHAVVLAARDAITADDLPRELRELRPATDRPAPRAEGEDELPHDLEGATLAFQKRHVARVLESCGGHRARAAQLLGVSPATFFRHLRKLDLKGSRGGDGNHA